MCERPDEYGKQKYRQCDLRKKTATGEIRQISYIPVEYAVVGKFLKLRSPEDGEWTNGWKVFLLGLSITIHQIIIKPLKAIAATQATA